MDAKLRKAWSIVRRTEWLFWAPECYDPAVVYRALLVNGYVWDRRSLRWAA